MNREREKIIECAVLTLVGLLALAAILMFLPEASAQCVGRQVKAAGPFAMPDSVLSAARKTRSKQGENA